MSDLSLTPVTLFGRYLRPYRLYIALGCACALTAHGLTILGPLVLERAVDVITGEEMMPGHVTNLVLGIRGGAERFWGTDLHDIPFFAILFLSLAVIGGVFRFGMRKVLNGMSRYVEYDIRNDFFAHLLKLSQSTFQKTPTGDLMARATNDLEAVRMFLGMGLRFSLEAAILFTASLGVMLTINVPLTIYALLPLPVFSVVVNRLSSRVHLKFRDIQDHFSVISARVQENLSGMRVVKAYAQEENEISAYALLNKTFLEKNRALVILRSIFFPLMFMMGGTCVATILWIGGRLVIQDELTLGQFVAFNGFLMLLIFPMIAVGWVMDLYQRGTASMKRINEILAIEPEIQDLKVDRKIRDIRGEIEFRGLNFAYNGRPVLRDIDLRIPAGAFVGLVGRVGCGKTTFARLIPRMIKGGSGQVLIDGVDIERIPLRILRNHIGFVPQDTFLFSDNLRKNVTFGFPEDFSRREVDDPSGPPPDPTRDEDRPLRRSADVAQLSKDISEFPNKFGTLVGERGITLSGGQRQRTALARAIIRDPSILILDDALSSVDTHTAEDILAGLREEMKGRTCLVVAHRILTIKDADLIVVMDEGRIVAQGTHEELVAAGGIYADMAHRQALISDLERMR